MMRKVQIVYYLNHGGGLLEHPHLLEVSTSSTGLLLRDVKRTLSSLRGNLMPSYFSWSYKRSYKQGYVWQDLESDNDPIFPTHDGSEYVLIGCKIESPRIVQTFVCPPNMHHNGTVSTIDNIVPTPTWLLSGEAANKKMAGSSRTASLLASGDNIIGNMEGFEGLQVDKERHQHSKAMDKERHQHNKAMEQDRVFPCRRDDKGACALQQSSLQEHALKGQIGSHFEPEFKVLTRAGCCGGSNNASPYGDVVDAATQTGEHEEKPLQTEGKSMIGPYANLSCHEFRCLPTQTTGSLASTSREGFFSSHRLITEMELSREEISPPPCSTTSSTIMSSTHSTSSSNNVLSLDHPKPSLDQSTCMEDEDQILEEKDSLVSASRDESACNTSCAKPTWTMINHQSTYGGHKNGNTFCISEDSQLPKLDASTIKPNHAMSICSSSGRFLHVVSCGGGLAVINPTRRVFSVRHKDHAVDGEETLASTELPLKEAKNDDVCMLRSNVVSGSCPPPSLANRGDGATALFLQLAGGNTKKLCHLKGWVDSQYKKIKSLKGGLKSGSSTTSAAIEDSYASLDLYEKQEANSSTKESIEEEATSPHSSRLHHIT